jgi:hypothetical protein
MWNILGATVSAWAGSRRPRPDGCRSCRRASEPRAQSAAVEDGGMGAMRSASDHAPDPSVGPPTPRRGGRRRSGRGPRGAGPTVSRSVRSAEHRLLRRPPRHHPSPSSSAEAWDEIPLAYSVRTCLHVHRERGRTRDHGMRRDSRPLHAGGRPSAFSQTLAALPPSRQASRGGLSTPVHRTRSRDRSTPVRGLARHAARRRRGGRRRLRTRGESPPGGPDSSVVGRLEHRHRSGIAHGASPPRVQDGSPVQVERLADHEAGDTAPKLRRDPSSRLPEIVVFPRSW